MSYVSTADLVTPQEFSFTPEQELRLLSDRDRTGTRWWIADAGAVPPGPRIVDRALADPWLPPWRPLNDPQTDGMAGACVLDQDDASRGILVFLQPTKDMYDAWVDYCTPYRSATLGCEIAIEVEPPVVDYRVVFRRVVPGTMLGSSVRWSFTRPEPGLPAWDVITAGWTPHRRRTVSP